MSSWLAPFCWTPPLCGARLPLAIALAGRADGAMSRAMSGEIEWRVSEGLVPYDDALAEMEARAAAVRAGEAARAGLAARASAAVHRRHQRRSGRTVQPDGFPGVTRPAAAAATPITGPASGSATSSSTSKSAGKDIRCFVHSLEGWMIAALGELGVEARREPGRIGIWTGHGAGRGQDRRDRRPREALGDAARLFDQRRAGPLPLRRNRALRHRRIWRDQPRRAWAGMPRWSRSMTL